MRYADAEIGLADQYSSLSQKLTARPANDLSPSGLSQWTSHSALRWSQEDGLSLTRAVAVFFGRATGTGDPSTGYFTMPRCDQEVTLPAG
jgi:hypothetical protein